jgi:hypothetical protein
MDAHTNELVRQALSFGGGMTAAFHASVPRHQQPPVVSGVAGAVHGRAGFPVAASANAVMSRSPSHLPSDVTFSAGAVRQFGSPGVTGGEAPVASFGTGGALSSVDAELAAQFGAILGDFRGHMDWSEQRRPALDAYAAARADAAAAQEALALEQQLAQLRAVQRSMRVDAAEAAAQRASEVAAHGRLLAQIRIATAQCTAAAGAQRLRAHGVGAVLGGTATGLDARGPHNAVAASAAFAALYGLSNARIPGGASIPAPAAGWHELSRAVGNLETLDRRLESTVALRGKLADVIRTLSDVHGGDLASQVAAGSGAAVLRAERGDNRVPTAVAALEETAPDLLRRVLLGFV